LSKTEKSSEPEKFGRTTISAIFFDDIFCIDIIKLSN